MTQPRLARAGGAGDEHVRHLREVGPDRVAVDPLAEPGDAAARSSAGRPGVDVAEADHAAALVRDLDADRLFARDRRQDADVGRGQRVGEVVAELGDFLDLGAGRQPQLVAGDVRAADDADDLRLDPEVAERLDQLAADRVLVARVGALVGPLALLERVAGRRPVVDLLGGGDAALVALRREGGSRWWATALGVGLAGPRPRRRQCDRRRTSIVLELRRCPPLLAPGIVGVASSVLGQGDGRLELLLVGVGAHHVGGAGAGVEVRHRLFLAPFLAAEDRRLGDAAAAEEDAAQAAAGAAEDRARSRCR